MEYPYVPGLGARDGQGGFIAGSMDQPTQRQEPQTSGWPVSEVEKQWGLESIKLFGRWPNQASQTFKDLMPQYPDPKAEYFSLDPLAQDQCAPAVLWKKMNERSGLVDILLMGDSMTFQWSDVLMNAKYCDPLNIFWRQNFFKYGKAMNFGVAGDMTQNVLWRMEHGSMKTYDTASRQGVSAKLVLLAIGTNGVYNFTGQNFSADGQAKGVLRCAQRALELQPNADVILVKRKPPITPR
jgi:hypothetical protein